MEACLRSLNLQEKGKLDPIIYGSTCNHLGNIYVELSDFSKAEHYHLLSLHNRQSVSFQEGIGKSYLNLGKLYFLTQRVDSAGLMALKARRIFEETGYTKGKIKCLILSGQVSTVKGAYEDAEHLFNEALQFSEVTGYSKGIVYASYYKGILYLTQNMPDEALSWFTKSLALCRKKGIQEVELDNYLALQKCYTLKSDYPEANKLALQYATAKEKYLISLYNKRLADVQINYESVKSMRIQESLQSENILKEARLKRKNLLILFIIATLLFLFILTVFIYSRYRFKQKDNRILKELNAELQLVNIEKDRFLSIIAHELRNPLWWVKNITETLSQRFDSMNRDQIYTILLTLDDSAKNTFMLMDNLLNWSRSKLNLLPCKPGYFNVEDLMQMNLDQFSVMISQKELTVNAAYLHEGNGFGDKDHYLIIFRNLISNAIKFTPAGGRIEIRTSNRNGYVFVCIQDNGIGIDKEMISRLFDEITSYSTLGLMQEKGAGLGLKLSRDFANKNGGDLRVSCGPEKGTTVEVLIPCNPVPLLQEA
jgi:signal transduction histidine kinase